MMQIIVIGGNLLISSEGEFRRNIIYRLVKEMAMTGEKLIVLHGGGRYIESMIHSGNLHIGFTENWQLEYVSSINKKMADLNSAVVDQMLKEGMKPISISQVSTTINDIPLYFEKINTEFFDIYLRLGFTPISYSSIVPDVKRGLSLCKPDQIAEELSNTKGLDRVIFLIEVDGIYDRYPTENGAKLLEEIYPGGYFGFALKDGNAIDGIEMTIHSGLAIAKKGVEVLVINGLVEGRLEKAIKGESVPGTRIRWKKDD